MIKRPETPMITCTLCDGAGKRPAHGTGRLMRMERDSRTVTREQLIEHFHKPDGTNYSPTHLIDLERDSRAWSLAMIESYRVAIEAAVKQRLEVQV